MDGENVFSVVGENVFRWLEGMYLDGWRECI